MGRSIQGTNNKMLKDRRRKLRRRQTEAEVAMWKELRGRRLANARFVRQYSLGSYILDFYCPEFKIAVELDGGVHDLEEVKIYDKDREAYLHELGLDIIRFKNAEIEMDIGRVISAINTSLIHKRGRVPT